jgi:hypothetical protein
MDICPIGQAVHWKKVSMTTDATTVHPAARMLAAVFHDGKSVAFSVTMPLVIPQVLSEAQHRET